MKGNVLLETFQKAALMGWIKGTDNTMRLKWGNELRPREGSYYLGVFPRCFSLEKGCSVKE